MSSQKNVPEYIVGYFYVIDVNLPNRPQKHGLCICTNGVDLFFVNSQARSCKEPVALPNRPGWKYPWNDSFIDVALIRKYQPNQIKREIGKLHCDDCQSVMDAVKSSSILNPMQITKITNELLKYQTQNCPAIQIS